MTRFARILNHHAICGNWRRYPRPRWYACRRSYQAVLVELAGRNRSSQISLRKTVTALISQRGQRHKLSVVSARIFIGGCWRALTDTRSMIAVPRRLLSAMKADRNSCRPVWKTTGYDAVFQRRVDGTGPDAGPCPGAYFGGREAIEAFDDVLVARRERARQLLLVQDQHIGDQPRWARVHP